MNNQQTTFWIFISISIALAIYGIVCGRWLIRKSLQLAGEVKGDRSRALKALAMWPISIVALIVIPLCFVLQCDRFHIDTDHRKIVFVISLVPSCLYNLYYRFKLDREYEKKR